MNTTKNAGMERVEEIKQMHLENKPKLCNDCFAEFVFTAGEQRFILILEAEGKTNSNGSPIIYTEPKRCAGCRMKRKLAKKNTAT